MLTAIHTEMPTSQNCQVEPFQNSRPTETMRENDCCLSLLSFEVVCYTAMVTLNCLLMPTVPTWGFIKRKELVQELSGAQHLVPALKQEKKYPRPGKEEIKLSLFADDMTKLLKTVTNNN